MAMGSGAVAWSDGFGVWAAWPDSRDAVQVGLPDFIDPSFFPELWWSDDGDHLALRAGLLGNEADDVFFTWTPVDTEAVRGRDETGSEAPVWETDSWLLEERGALHRIVDGVARLLEGEVCTWTHGYGRVAWASGDCADVGDIVVLDLASGTEWEPFLGRTHFLSPGPDGVLALDGTPGTAWSLDGVAPPREVAQDLDSVFASPWSWLGLRGDALVGDGWQTPTGTLRWLELGQWHAVQVVEREGRREIDVVLLAR